ncbi:MAG: GSCFA domain-containing protein [Bacteroidia bacterium]
MNFYLNYTPPKLPLPIDHSQKILLMGSCFTEYIGMYFSNFKFDALVNPNGILFNPASIGFALETYIKKNKAGAVIQNNGLFSDLNYHGDFSSASEQDLNEMIRGSQQIAHDHLKNSQWLIVTFGSAFVYRHLKTDRIVANCHKLPQNEFRKELLMPADIIKQYNKLIPALQRFVPGLNILFTVSPVKYLRDGLIENNRSKSILIHSVHEIIGSNTACFYFPAYELVSDDLRDYRFYKEDLAHPNEQAIAYVWNKFSECAFSGATQKLNNKISEILAAASHRPVHPGSAQHQKFKADYLKKCRDLETEFSFWDFTKEKNIFSA